MPIEAEEIKTQGVESRVSDVLMDVQWNVCGCATDDRLDGDRR
ncbi:hypothetical protein AG1IA_07162 [Rhizoctonia solani AG-1 IA]|uniref:Uncharacterized protein n=1 Tax=Thanatephorus cucumeris (strain AG1-IA) TaxID=983506 RepID=L8WPX3_THACA|nr:hypothetical protein AG1IA_07162 [Rhizoctonia solani AG-1 IA]